MATYLAAVMKASVAGARVEEQAGQVAGVVRAVEGMAGEAGRTREFWRSLPRLAGLRTPARRILLDSRSPFYAQHMSSALPT